MLNITTEIVGSEAKVERRRAKKVSQKRTVRKAPIEFPPSTLLVSRQTVHVTWSPAPSH